MFFDFSSSAIMSYEVCHPPQVVSCIIHVFGVLAEYALILKIIQVGWADHFQSLQQKNNNDHYPVGEAERCKSPQGIPQSAKQLKWDQVNL